MAERYSNNKRFSNLMDFDDLLIILKDKLMNNDIFRKQLKNSIKYILVDEFQDSNSIQYEIIKLLAGNTGRITIVGDDQQSIYGFRGANVDNFLNIHNYFQNCGIVKLEVNYRSHQGILDFVNNISNSSKNGIKKRLKSETKSINKPIIKNFSNNLNEAEFIVNKIMELKNETNLDYSDFAILVRNKSYSDVIQLELQKQKISFHVVNGSKINERKHIKDIIYFLRVIINPIDAVA